MKNKIILKKIKEFFKNLFNFKNKKLLVQNNDVNQYLYILKNIIPHINRNELGEIAYKYVSNKFSMFKMRDEYEKLYSLI